ncbi:hypothetical protein EmuJ_001144900 [Echinococcus multilocularis]|uniref:Uncharacterized protein n=1 Tax=Echinococcus multilocularis TaxID=6211 RepID=A0A068YGG7_ECHMU|nr:hypothetical protein EmuJ_001144900 [Echinococcus multilocularis]
MDTGKQSCVWDSHITHYSKDTADFLKTLINDSKLANKFRCEIRDKLTKGQPLPSTFKDSVKSKTQNCAQSNKRPTLGALRTRDKIIASGAYELPKPRLAKEFKSREEEKKRLASIFAYGEDLKIEKTRSARTAEENSACISRFDELFDELRDRQTFLEEMRRLGKAADYKTQIQSEISQIVNEMEEIDKRENSALAQLRQKDHSRLYQRQTDAN